MRKVEYLTKDGFTTSYSKVEGRPHITILEDVKEEMSAKEREHWTHVREVMAEKRKAK